MSEYNKPSFDDLETNYEFSKLHVELHNPESLRLETRKYISNLFSDNYTERKGSRALTQDEPLLSIGRPGVIGTEQLKGVQITPKKIVEILEN